MDLHVLTWNLKHGRSMPSAGRQLLEEFAALIALWEWDVALLQEVPPWWPRPLAERAGAQQRLVLTSRNWLLPLRRVAATRWPDVIKSNGGGANAILVRRGEIAEHRVQRLGWWPERRWMHAVQLASGLWLGNLHTNSDPRQGARAADALGQWSRGSPTLLGGDFNVRQPLLPGFSRAGGNGVDQVYVTEGFRPEMTRLLDRGQLSDHTPVLVSVSLRSAGGA